MTYEMTEDVLNQLQDELSNFMDDIHEYRTDYSGRAMYGKTCIGWTHDETDLRFGLALYQAILEVATANEDSDNQILQLARQQDYWQLFVVIGGGRSDSMGTSTITYFPDLVASS